VDSMQRSVFKDGLWIRCTRSEQLRAKEARA
jgi:hypothetical protein